MSDPPEPADPNVGQAEAVSNTSRQAKTPSLGAPSLGSSYGQAEAIDNGIAQANTSSTGGYALAVEVQAPLSGKCSNCGKTGHDFKACTKNKKGRACSNCGLLDHLLKKCPYPGLGNKLLSGELKGGKSCHLCGSRYHLGPECDGCKNCRTGKHSRIDCPNKHCRTCYRKGHWPEGCPNRPVCKWCGHYHKSKDCKTIVSRRLLSQYPVLSSGDADATTATKTIQDNTTASDDTEENSSDEVLPASDDIDASATQHKNNPSNGANAPESSQVNQSSAVNAEVAVGLTLDELYDASPLCSPKVSRHSDS